MKIIMIGVFVGAIINWVLFQSIDTVMVGIAGGIAGGTICNTIGKRRKRNQFIIEERK